MKSSYDLMNKSMLCLFQDADAKTAESGAGEEIKVNPAMFNKSLSKIVAEHKDIMKLSIQLNTIVSSLQSPCRGQRTHQWLQHV